MGEGRATYLGEGRATLGTPNIGFRAGVHIGGTLTDIVLAGEDGQIATSKVSSTSGDYSRAIIEGLQKLPRRNDVQGGAIRTLKASPIREPAQ